MTLIDHIVGKIAVDRVDAGGGELGLEFKLFVERLLVLLVGEVALLVHREEDVLLAAFVRLGMGQRVIGAGRVGDADDRRGLGDRQLADVLAEIGVRGGLHAVGAVVEVDGVQIGLQDLILGVAFFQVEGAEDFLHLAFDTHLVVAGDVFDKLLVDGRAAGLGGIDRDEHVDERAEGALPVDALVRPEALVLDGDNRLLHVLGDFIQ